MARRYGLGMAGCMIVVVALLGSILAGFCLDVSKQTRPVTDYDYVTDVTGLFTIDQSPDYIQYAPSTNYTGYTDITSMQYSISATPNNYRIVLDPAPPASSSATLNSVTPSSLSAKWLYGPGAVLGNSNVIQTGDYSSSQQCNGELTGAVTISTLITGMGLQNDYVTLANPNSPNAILLHGDPSTYMQYYSGGGTAVDRIWIFGNNECYWDTIEYDPVTAICKVYSGTTELFYESASKLHIAYSYWYNHSSYLNFDGYRGFGSTSITASYVGQPVYSYINPAEGVALQNSTSTTWENGYHNDTINITVSRATVGSNNLTIQTGDAVGDESKIEINASATGNMNVVVTGMDGVTTTTKVLGRWDTAQITISASNGTVAVTPIVGTPSFTASSELNGTTITFNQWYSGGDIDSLKFSTTGVSLKFGITDTWVFLDTYQSVIFNPTITITDYFPDLTDWRLNFYSFALTGNQITVNGVAYPVDTNQVVTIGTGDDAVTGTLSNVYITKLDGNIYFTFADMGQTVDLGTAITDEVSFSGRWFFTTGLYNAVPGIEEYYDWNLDGGWHATTGQILMVFLGLLALGTIIAHGVMRIPLRVYDVVILAMAGIIAIILGGMSI